MASLQFSNKRLQINKANASMVIAIAIASFVVTTALIAGRALLSQRNYQARVISEKEKALKQLQDNLQAVDSLVASYKEFAGSPDNILGGDPKGVGDKDGDNPKLVLDALPSKYDFPALVTSLEKLLKDYKINGISGSDDEIKEKENVSSPTPQPVEMPFQIAIGGGYGSMQNLIGTLERSIRPLHIVSMNLSGTDAQMQLTITAKTYYQPEKSLNISTKVVK